MPAQAVRWSLCSSAVLLLSCSSPTGMCACPPARTHGVIYGRTVSATGQPIEGAVVRATVYGSVCGQQTGEAAPVIDPRQTGPTGDYRLHIYSHHGPRTACVRVVVHPMGSADSVFADAALAMLNERVKPDSVRIDFELP
jgi:hypothetical protein